MQNQNEYTKPKKKKLTTPKIKELNLICLTKRYISKENESENWKA